MLAVVVEPGETGRPLLLRETKRPTPGDGEVLVRVHATALDRVDTFIRRGTHGMKSAQTAFLGRDLAGVVEAIGTGVDSIRVGDRVLACGTAAHAEFAIAPAALTVVIPDGWSFVEAAALPTAGRTAYSAVTELAGVRPGDRVLVTAAGGGVGSSAVQLCRLIGAEVISTVGPAWKESRARDEGAAHVFRHDRPGWGARILAEVGPVSAVIETVGGAAWPEALDALAPGGTVVCCGVSSGHHLDLHLGHLMTRGWRLLGIGRPDRATVRQHILRTLEVFDQGGIRPIVDRVYSLQDSASAHEAMESSAFFGRIILTPTSGGEHTEENT